MPTTTTAPFDQHKFDELVLHVAELSSDDVTFGKTKLNKIMYYVDFYAYGVTGKSITGATYQRRQFGPVPKQIAAARQRLVASGRVRFDEISYFGRPLERMTPLEGADVSAFTLGELQLISEVVRGLRDLNGSQASEMSHQEVGWILAADGETIPYETVFLNAPALTTEDIARGREIESELERRLVAA